MQHLHEPSELQTAAKSVLVKPLQPPPVDPDLFFY